MTRQACLFVATSAIMMVTPLVALAQSSSSCEVKGRWSANPSEVTSFGWFSNRARAEAYIAETRRAYGPGGLQESATNKPTGLYIVDSKQAKTQPAPQSPSFYDRVVGAYRKFGELSDSVDNVNMVRWVAKLLNDPDAAMKDKTAEGMDQLAKAQGLKDYIKNIQDSYQRAKDAKDMMMSLEKSEMDKQFKSVNDLIARYNKEANGALERFGKSADVFPKVSQVGPGTVKKVGDWQTALKQQFALEAKKDELDRRKTELDTQHKQLTDGWKAAKDEIKPFDPANPKVVSLRQKLDQYLAEKAKYDAALQTYESDNKHLSQSVAALKPIGNSILAAKPEKKVDPKAISELGFRRWTAEG
jgi:hypothetical protein